MSDYDTRTTQQQPLNIRHGKSRWEGHRVFARILMAMTCVECGIRMDEVDRESIEQGWRMAFGKSPKGKNEE